LRNEAEEAARNLLLEWAAQRHANGEASLSELAAETGVPIEVIEEHVSGQRSAAATDMYLTSARRLAEALKTPRFYAEAKRAVKAATKDAAAGGRR
jgi:hypothetical protein